MISVVKVRSIHVGYKDQQKYICILLDDNYLNFYWTHNVQCELRGGVGQFMSPDKLFFRGV